MDPLKAFYDIGDGQALALNASPHQFYDELMLHSYPGKIRYSYHENRTRCYSLGI